MEDKETINILIAQLLSKDDEILRLRNLLDDLQREQQSGNMQILSKLDRALEELKSMRHDNKTLSNRLSRALEAKSAAEEKIQELSSALEALENTRADELYEIARQKRQLYGRKSEKKSSLSAMKQKDLKEDKDDFDGSAPSAPVEDLEQKAAESASSEAAPRSESPSCRKDYGKQSTGAENVVVHYCDESDIPSGARKIGIREWIQYSIQHQVVKHVFKLVRLVDTQGNISNYYQPTDKNDTRRPFENVLEGYPVDFELMARILVDKYQYGLSLERVVDRLKDAGARFNTSTVLAWIKRHMKELCKLEEPFRQLLLTPGSMLFSDETTEQVRVYNQQKGKYEYRKQYIWGIKNPDRKIAYYLYDNGSRSMKVAQKFFAGFRGSVTTDGYNVYKMFEREDSSITRYGCMAHVRRKFVDALQTDHRSADIINLISNLYWVEADCRINLLSEDERRMERQKRAIPILAEIWQMIKPVFEQTRGDTANLFLKAVRYAVNEWEAVSRYVQNGKAEIDNNPAERMMKPICMGRKNYLFCGSELAHDFIIENARAFCKTFPPKIRNSLSGHFHLTVNSSAFCRAFVIFLSILSAGPVHAPLSAPSRRFHRPQGPDAGKAGPGGCHSHPVPTGFQPEEIGRKRKGKAAHALPQRQKAIVDPRMGEAEQVGGKGRQNRRQRRVAEGEARIAGHHAPALCKGKPRRQPGRHRKQQHVGGAAADSVTEQGHQQAACRTAHAAQYHAP